MLEAADQLQRLEIALQRSDPLAHILGEVADALEIGRDPHRTDDLAQVHRHRLAPRDGQHRALLDHMLQVVDFGIGSHHALAQRDIAADQRIDGIDDHAFGQAAHLGDQPSQFLKIAVERLGGMLCSHLFSPYRCRGSGLLFGFSAGSLVSPERARTDPHQKLKSTDAS